MVCHVLHTPSFTPSLLYHSLILSHSHTHTFTISCPLCHSLPPSHPHSFTLSCLPVSLPPSLYHSLTPSLPHSLPISLSHCFPPPVCLPAGEVGEGGGISNGDPTEGESEPLQQQPEDSLPEAGASATEVPGPSSSDDQPRPSGTDDQPGPSGTDDQPGPSGANDLPGSSGAAEAAAPGEGETEEESDLKLAWEVLELARLICLQ